MGRGSRGLALKAWVIRPGFMRVGDGVRVILAPEGPGRLGGWIVGAPYSHLNA